VLKEDEEERFAPTVAPSPKKIVAKRAEDKKDKAEPPKETLQPTAKKKRTKKKPPNAANPLEKLLRRKKIG